MSGTTFENFMQDCYSCGLITVDRSGNITSLNPEAERVLQLPALPSPAAAAKTLPLPITKLIHEVFQTGKPAANRKITLDASKPAATTLSVTAMPVSGELGFSVVAMLSETAATARLEHNLRRLDRLARIGTLSAGLAHEIKNALVSVKTFVDLLLEKNQDAELAETVRHEITRMDGLVTHMLRFAAPPHAVVGRVHLHTVLERSLQMAQTRAGSKTISIQRHFTGSEISVPGDEPQLEQAFINLLFNAVDALGENGTLEVHSALAEAPGGSHVVVRIADTGEGIAADNLAQIFQPFFTTKPRGTGLGLAITRGIIEEHKGEIRVESQVGKGTCFTISLPAGEPQAHA
ncbi:MAG: ATP-binding protein [Verrucomicrobiota bacterium]